jgi:phosphohistidine phosphatase
MKTAVFMRHGHAEEGSDDHARDLTPEGRRAVQETAQELRASDFAPDVIITSSACRTRATAELVAQALGFERSLVERRDLYLAEPAEYLAAVRELEEGFETALLVAHNPGLEGLAQRLGRSRRLRPAAYFLVSSRAASWQDFGS